MGAEAHTHATRHNKAVLTTGTVVARTSIAHAVMAGAAVQLSAGLALVTLALTGVHHAWAMVLPMIVFGVSHGIVQPSAQVGALAPFPRNAGVVAALMGFLIMVVASAVGIWIGASYNSTVYPLTLTIGACATTLAAVACIWVRQNGDVSKYS